VSVIFPPTARLDFEWVENTPEEISYDLALLEGYFENRQALTEALKEMLESDMAMKFETETDPSGSPWQPLKEPAKDQVGILRLTEDMFNAATSESAWSATPQGVFFDTGMLPPYWAFHEQPDGGAHRIPKREFIGPSMEAQAKAASIAGMWLDSIIEAVAAPSMFTPASGMFNPLATRGAVTRGTSVGIVTRGVFRRQIHDPATGRFVSTKGIFV
jgi:hypothetical protein